MGTVVRQLVQELSIRGWMSINEESKGPGGLGGEVFERLATRWMRTGRQVGEARRKKSFSQSSEKNGDDEFSGTHLLDRRDKTRALNRMWWGGGCGDGRGLGAIPAPKLLSGSFRIPSPLFTGEEAGGEANGR